jgi:hypothetical protein
MPSTWHGQAPGPWNSNWRARAHLEDLGGGSPDGAGPHDADRLRAHLEAHETVERVVALPHTIGRRDNVAVEGQRQRDRVLRHTVPQGPSGIRNITTPSCLLTPVFRHPAYPEEPCI